MNQKTLNYKENIEKNLFESFVEFKSEATIDPVLKGYLINIQTEHCTGVFSDSGQGDMKYYIFNNLLIELLEEQGKYQEMSEEEKDKLPVWVEVDLYGFIQELKGKKVFGQ